MNIQCPRQIPMEIFVDSFHVLKSDLLSEHHLVERANEKRIQKSSVENRKANNSPDELEIVQVLWVDAGVRVNLQCVIIVCRVLKETIERIEHFMREKEEILARLTIGVSGSVQIKRKIISRHTEKAHRNPNHPHRRI